MHIRGFLLLVCGISLIASTTSLHTLRRHGHGHGNGNGMMVSQQLESGSTTQMRVADVLDDLNSELVVRQWQLVFSNLGITPPAPNNPRTRLQRVSDEPDHDGPDVGEKGQKRSQQQPQVQGGGGEKKQKTLLQTSEQSHAYVPFTAWPFTTAAAARTAVRGSGGLHGVKIDSDHPDYVLYVLDVGQFAGRVMSVSFNVVQLMQMSKPSVEAGEYCDIIWNTAGTPSGGIVNGIPVQPLKLVASLPGAAPSRPTGMWQNGHIIAASLGGDNNDPLNFFPHHVLSNTYHSVWFRMEAMAAAMRKFLTSDYNCQVKVYIEFTYGGVSPRIAPVSGNLWVPDGGFYEIRLNQACHDHLSRMPKFMATEYGAPFVKHAVLVAASGPALHVPKKSKGYSLRVRWENRPNTAVRSLPPGIPLNPDYQLAPELFN